MTARTTTPDRPDLDTILGRVLSDHWRVRALLDEIDDVAAAMAGQRQARGANKLPEVVWRLFVLFDDHLALEERELTPFLVEQGIWKAGRVEDLRREHKAQRTMLLALLGECDAKAKSDGELANDARWLIESLRKDVTHEDAEFESVRTREAAVQHLHSP